MNGKPKRFNVLASDWRFIAVIVLLGLAIRLDFLIAAEWSIDADEAIVGLMASDISHGLGVPTFYYGQHYMGSLEPLLVSAGFALFGASELVLKSVPLLFSLALILIVYRLAYDLAGYGAARVAALLCAVPPSPLVVWSAMARGGFIEVVVIGAGALLLTTWWLRAAQPRAGFTALIALLLGLGWWVNNQIIYFMLPIGFFIGCRLLREESRGRRVFPWPSVGRHVLAGVLGFFAGGFAFWEYNFRNHFVSFEIFHGSGSREVLKHFIGLFSVSLPMILGGKRFWSDASIFPFAGAVVLIFYALLLGLVLMYRRASIRKLFALRVDNGHPVELFLMFALCCVAVFACSSFGWLVEAPRYLLPLYVAVFVLTGYVVALIGTRKTAPALGVACCCLALNVLSCYWGGRAVPGEPFVYGGERVSRNDDDLVDWLDEHDVDFVRTNYWIGYRLAFETDQAVRFVHFGDPQTVRIPAWEEEAAALDPKEIPYVLVPTQALLARKAFGMLGYRYEEARLSGYLVFYNVEPQQQDLKAIDRSRFAIRTSDNAAAAELAVDGDESTRWGSAHPQLPGMQFTVEFKTPTTVRGLSYDLGRWAISDYPRGLGIEAELADGKHRTLLQPGDYEALRYFNGRQNTLSFYWAPFKVRSITLTETEHDPVFDWSIAELGVYE